MRRLLIGIMSGVVSLMSSDGLDCVSMEQSVAIGRLW